MDWGGLFREKGGERKEWKGGGWGGWIGDLTACEEKKI